MANLRLMFVGHGPSGLPEDRIVNTFHFSTTDSIASVHAALALDAVVDFYNNVDAAFPQSNPIGAYLSPWVQRVAEIRTYNMDDALPRVPAINAFTLPDALSTTGFPEETAICLTLEGEGLPVTRRRRGRLYIGPLCSTAISPGGSTVPCRPSTIVKDDLCAAATRLARTTSPITLGWSIRSTRPTPNFVPIGKGYVDDALDTQRRRGPAPTSRLAWTGDLG